MSAVFGLLADAWDPSRETHREWRRRRALESQRSRRAQMRRIDYYASEEANAIIDRQRTRFAGGDASSVLNRIVTEWATRSGITADIARASARARTGALLPE